MTLANIVARMERSEIRDSRDPGSGLRGACHRAALRADPLAPSGLQPLTIRPAQVICPSGGLSTGLSSLFSDFPKNISVPTYPKSIQELFASHPTRGAYHDRHERGEGCGGRGSVLRAMAGREGFGLGAITERADVIC